MLIQRLRKNRTRGTIVSVPAYPAGDGIHYKVDTIGNPGIGPKKDQPFDKPEYVQGDVMLHHLGYYKVTLKKGWRVL